LSSSDEKNGIYQKKENSVTTILSTKLLEGISPSKIDQVIFFFFF